MMLCLAGAALVLLMMGIVSPAARASTESKAPTTPRGAPGGAKPSSATSLQTGFSYMGTVTKRGGRLWYRLQAGDAKRLLFHLRGKSRSCSVRASVLDARGKSLGQLISSPAETQPFVVLVPATPVSDTYYLRIDASPFEPCAGARYVFTLVEPGQGPLTPCETPGAALAAPLSKACGSDSARAPSMVARAASGRDACERVGPQLGHATFEVARVRRLVLHRKARVGTLRRLESERRALVRLVYHLCNEL
jgi:hypothetical protein